MECCSAAAQQSPFVARALPLNYNAQFSLPELYGLRQHECQGREQPQPPALKCVHLAAPRAFPLGRLHARIGRSVLGSPEAQGLDSRGSTTMQAHAHGGAGAGGPSSTGDLNGTSAEASVAAQTSDRAAGAGPGALLSPVQGHSSGRRRTPPRLLRSARAHLYLARKQLRSLTLQSLSSSLFSLFFRWRRFVLGAALLAAVVLKLRAPSAQAPVPVPYSSFLNAVSSGCVSSARLEPGSTRVLFNCPPGATLVRTDTSADSPLRPPSRKEAPSGRLAKGRPDSAVEAAAGRASVAVGGANAAQGAGQQAHCWREEVLQLSPVLGSLIAPCPPPAYQFQCHRLAQDDAFLLARLDEHGTPFVAVPRSSTERLSATLAEAGILWLALAPLMALALRFVSGRTGGNAWRPFDGKKRGRGEGVGFEDVAGVDIAKAELMELVKCLRGGPGSRAASALGAQLPRGVLLVGPPGTGKTLLARAVAWESGVPFFAASGSEFVELFVGRGAARVRELFSAARRAAPAVVFIDEIDAVGSARGRGNNEEREQTLNQLLTELDGFDTRDDGVLLLAATNRQDVLDPALCRAGRISRRVMVPLPDDRGRRDILLVHLRHTACQGGEEGKLAAAAAVAAVTPGFSGAELQNVVNEAALLAAREGATEVSLMQLVEAVQRSRFGVGSGRGGGPLATVATWVQQAALKRLSLPKTA